MVAVVMLITPPSRLIVQGGNRTENPTGQEISLHILHEALDSPFGKRMPRLAELRTKTYCLHEGFILRMPYGMSEIVPTNHNTLHVVGENVIRDSHFLKSMYHPYKQVLLARVGEEFYIKVTTVVADHGKAGKP